MSVSPPSPAPASGPLAQARARLGRHRAVLLAAGAVLLLLVFAGRLGAPEALVGFLVIAGIAALSGGLSGTGSAPGAGADAGTSLAAAARAVADALVEPCILLDSRSVVAHVNPAAAREFPGARVGEPIGLSLRLPALLAAIETARATGAPQSAELHQTVPAESWHRVDVAPLGAEASGTLLVTLRNQTEQKRIDALRTDFIANASHELRTPLTSLVGFIDTLLGPAANDATARRRFLSIMRTQAARMSKLIDDLLSLSRIEMRQHMRPTGRADLAILLREVREGLQTQAEEGGVRVELSLPDAPAVVTGDRDELYEVFENLLDNAIKYGGAGGLVEVGLSVETRQGFDFAVDIVDHGAGIAPEHVPRLTERFYRVDAESSRKKKGTGLGLAIVKHIVNRHRGRLTIRSTPGIGTRVEVLLPA